MHELTQLNQRLRSMIARQISRLSWSQRNAELPCPSTERISITMNIRAIIE